MNKKGLVIEEETNAKKQKSYEAKSHFESIFSWQLDEPELSPKTESFNRAMTDWFTIMETVTLKIEVFLDLKDCEEFNLFLNLSCIKTIN